MTISSQESGARSGSSVGAMPASTTSHKVRLRRAATISSSPRIPADLMSENARYPTQTGAKVGVGGASLGERAQAPIIIGPGRDFSTCSHGDTDKSAAYSSGEVAGRLHTVDRRCRSLLSQCSLNRGRDASSVYSRRSPDPLVGLWRHHAHADCTVSDTSPGSDTNT